MALLAATGAAQDAQSRADAMTRNEIMAMTWAEAKATGNRYIMERWRKLDDEELEHKQTVWYRELPAKIERAKKQAEAERAKKQAEAERERARLEAERAALEAQLAETQRLIAEETARLERLAAYCGNGSLYFKRTMFGFGPWAEVDELSGESIPVEGVRREQRNPEPTIGAKGAGLGQRDSRSDRGLRRRYAICMGGLALKRQRLQPTATKSYAVL